MVAGQEQTKSRGCGVGLPLHSHSLQSDAVAEAVGGVGMSADQQTANSSAPPAIVEADIWDRHPLLPVRAGDDHERRQSAIFFNGPLAVLSRTTEARRCGG
jgi:hypothetical protein